MKAMINLFLKFLVLSIIFLAFGANGFGEDGQRCSKEIKIIEPSFYYQNLGELNYDGKRITRGDLYRVLLCASDKEVNRYAKLGNNWCSVGYGTGMFAAFGLITSIGITVNNSKSQNTMIAWLVTGSLLFSSIVSYTFSNYYYTIGIESYNKSIQEKKELAEDRKVKPVWFTMEYSYRFNYY
jgi:hypothetical protein